MEERPHEAPRSEVMETLDDWRNAWERYGGVIMTVIAVILIVFAVTRYLSSTRSNAHNEAWSSLAASTAPASYIAVAGETGDGGVRQNARLAAADLLLDEAIRDPTATGDAGTALLDRAEKQYQAILDEARSARSGAAGHPLYELNALEGLAVVAEARRDADLARTRFEAVIAAADAMPGMGRWSARARGHIEALPLLSEDVVFAPDPEPEPEPAATPEAGAPAEAAPADAESLIDAPVDAKPAPAP